MSNKPSLGSNASEIYENILKLTGVNVSPQCVIKIINLDEEPVQTYTVGPEGLLKLHIKKAKRGYVVMTSDVIPQNIFDFKEGIKKGCVQVNEVFRYGCMGVHDFSNAGEINRELHRSTGNPLKI